MIFNVEDPVVDPLWHEVEKYRLSFELCEFNEVWLVSFKEANAQEPLNFAWATFWVFVGIVFAGLTYYGFKKRRNMKRADARS